MWWNGDPATAKEHRPNGKTLTGSLPREIGQLTKARYIDLSFQGFTGTLPTEIGALKSAKYLSLYGCHFSGELPASLAHSLSSSTSPQASMSSREASPPPSAR